MNKTKRKLLKSVALGLALLAIWFFLLVYMTRSLDGDYSENSVLLRAAYWFINPFFFLVPILIGFLAGKINPNSPRMVGGLVGFVFLIVFVMFQIVIGNGLGFFLFGGVFLLILPVLTLCGSCFVRKPR